MGYSPAGKYLASFLAIKLFGLKTTSHGKPDLNKREILWRTFVLQEVAAVVVSGCVGSIL